MTTRDDNTMERETVAKGKREKDQEVASPDLPVSDELGFETLTFKCWKCARVDYREKNTAEAFIRGGHKLFCLVCSRPDLFEYEVETLADGTRREFIRPLSARETYKRISPEAHKLAAKQALVQCLRVRRDAILALTAQLELEYMSILPAIETAEKDVIETEMLVSAMEKDDIGKKIAEAQSMQEKVMRLVKEIEAAKQAQAEAEGK